MSATRISDVTRRAHDASATERVRSLGTETAFAVAAAARRVAQSGRDVVLLHIGEPGIPTPPHIVEAGIRALRDGITGYVAPAGTRASPRAPASPSGRCSSTASPRRTR